MKQQTILGALLLSNGRRVSLARLADVVWEQRPPVTARKQIRNAVSELRTLLSATGAAIVPEADGYRLDIADATLDLRTFQEHSARARRRMEQDRPDDAVTELRAALALWRGPVLSGLDRPGLRAQAAGLEEQRLTVLEECVGLELARGRHTALIGELTGAVADHPLRERLVGQLVLALYRSGARARAFAVYERTRRDLAETLGLDPGPELQELHQQMLADDTGAPAPAASRPSPAPAPAEVPLPAPAAAPGNLPGGVPHFTGRGETLRLLLDFADGDDRGDGAGRGERTGAGAGRVAVIEGMAGVGKTALAVHAAHRLAHRYPDGCLFLDLRGHSSDGAALPPAAGPVRLLRAVGVPVSERLDAAEAAGLWRGWLAGRRVLLVLDNVASTDQIRALPADGPGCLTIVTSRRSLTGLPTARPYFLDPLPLDEARRLFRRLVPDRAAGADAAGGPGRDATAEDVDTLLRHCGHHPLAIAAAAARLRHRPTWSVGYLADRLAEPGRRLTELRAEDGGVSSRIDCSYLALHPEQQRLLRLLGLVATPVVNAPGAAALAGLPVPRTEELLEGLVDEHLLQQPEAGHYRVHGLVQAYCAQLSRVVDTPEDRENALKGLHDFYMDRQLILSYAGDPCAF
ncbi:AfsR/SARP family transcriptional regulator [Streptomyces cinnamoneus]|uniref:AfsR/SARP family transcriptional regulator n=1 Tax=Streptomyces cinnamoneus TaxID=53446 RepID=UPI0015E29F0E|nr:AfsR/SARP family transcriptional regulator [Streptomyces cinnamoneus]